MSIIYQITNLITAQKYIGWSKKTSEERFKVHLQCARRGDKSHLYNSIRKYGEENFIVEELEKGDDDTYMLKEREPFYISQLTEEERLNITDGGIGGKNSGSFQKGHIPWNTDKNVKSISDSKKRYWEKWRKENPNYKDKWKKYEPVSKKRKEEVSKMHSGNMINTNKIMVECPHCSKTGNVGNMKRWHFDNCKYAKLDIN